MQRSARCSCILQYAAYFLGFLVGCQVLYQPEIRNTGVRYLYQPEIRNMPVSGIRSTRNHEYACCAGQERPMPVYMHAQRWGSGFKANLLPDACLIDRCGAMHVTSHDCTLEAIFIGPYNRKKNERLAALISQVKSQTSSHGSLQKPVPSSKQMPPHMNVDVFVLSRMG